MYVCILQYYRNDLQQKTPWDSSPGTKVPMLLQINAESTGAKKDTKNRWLLRFKRKTTNTFRHFSARLKQLNIEKRTQWESNPY